jgi:hypothetical protein
MPRHTALRSSRHRQIPERRSGPEAPRRPRLAQRRIALREDRGAKNAKRGIPFQAECHEGGASLGWWYTNSYSRKARGIVQAKLCHGCNKPSMERSREPAAFNGAVVTCPEPTRP